MQPQLSDHFSYKKLLRFTLPSVAMMIFSSIYGVVDGFFVSNYVGETPFAAVNFIMPFLMILGAIGFMFGTGGSALVSKTLGEGNKQRANSLFSLFVYVSFFIGILIAALGILFLRPITKLLGSSEAMLDYCVEYGTVILIALPAYMLQMEFQSFFITAEKPTYGLIFTLVSGFSNMFLDWLFVGVLSWELTGAAAATAVSQIVGGIGPLFYFFRKNSSLLALTKTKFDGKALLKCCTNGSSELMSNISMSVVSILYNAQLMKFAGEQGVAAYGTIMYVNFIFISAFIGYCIGIAPIVGYHFGAENQSELRSLRKKSVNILLIASVVMFALAECLALPLSKIFVGYNQALLDMTVHGFAVCSFSFLFSGISIFGSSFFTSLNNGLISAIVSFLRTLVFQIAAVLLLPNIGGLGLEGIWLSVVVAEILAVIVNVVFLVCMRKKYGY